ncbi:enoyl-CoA hydratase/isomerase family protein [Salisediminibacterium beveridgei]|uniref:Hydratase, crotonase/enoyl-CoA hydratase superfamily n=1 Tax=Salisediminibacterium beveridgei TaxID=632773 RepID=A0A1D7QW97_9BACI|nr:enoyl-CoA hydratase/isomerase family protein [Salisediminibacterium beveridgei]AOM83287.1 hydratase, crotonase/enoyl-CoA hydratase superfamily [Salisediminibacterium beveridgei]
MRTVEQSWLDKGVAKITLNRPHVKNAVNFDMLENLEIVLDQLERDKTLQAVLICGAGETFCSGGDLNDFHTLAGGADVYDHMLKPMMDQLYRIAFLPCPVTAFVEGAAIGGGAELAMACDKVILTPASKVGFIQVKLGIQTGWGGAELLSRHVDHKTVFEMLSTGELYSANDLEQKGLTVKASIPSVADLKNVHKKRADETMYQAMKMEALTCSRSWGSEKHGEMIRLFLDRQ